MTTCIDVTCGCGWHTRQMPRTLFPNLKNHILSCPIHAMTTPDQAWPDIPLEASESPPKTKETSEGHPLYLEVLEERKELHRIKSKGYGTGHDPFANFTAVADLTGLPRWVYPILRAEEKIQRCWSLFSQSRLSELGEEFMDISSLFDCAEAMRREDED
jgi:hypothetical protein